MAPLDLIAAVADLADELFATAPKADQSALVPRERLDRLAALGLYGLDGPERAGGMGVDGPTANRVVELLAGGCLTTTFIWVQHHSAVRALAALPDGGGELLGRLCRGEVRSGVAFSHLRRPGPPAITATASGDGWVLDGEVSWVTGVGRVDLIHAAAVTEAGDVVWCLIDAPPGAGLTATPLALAAVSASGTVTLRLSGVTVAPDRVLLVEPLEDWRRRDSGGMRRNGSLALGVAARALDQAGLGDQGRQRVDACRLRLEQATPETIAAARAAACGLALAATSRLLIGTGARGLLLDQQAQRLAREALFLQVFAQTPPIRAAQLNQGEPVAAV